MECSYEQDIGTAHKSATETHSAGEATFTHGFKTKDRALEIKVNKTGCVLGCGKTYDVSRYGSVVLKGVSAVEAYTFAQEYIESRNPFTRTVLRKETRKKTETRKTIIRKGASILIKPEWQNPGDDKYHWIATENENNGRVKIVPTNTGLPFSPVSTMFVAWLEINGFQRVKAE